MDIVVINCNNVYRIQDTDLKLVLKSCYTTLSKVENACLVRMPVSSHHGLAVPSVHGEWSHAWNPVAAW